MVSFLASFLGPAGPEHHASDEQRIATVFIGLKGDWYCGVPRFVENIAITVGALGCIDFAVFSQLVRVEFPREVA